MDQVSSENQQNQKSNNNNDNSVTTRRGQQQYRYSSESYFKWTATKSSIVCMCCILAYQIFGQTKTLNEIRRNGSSTVYHGNSSGSSMNDRSILEGEASEGEGQASGGGYYSKADLPSSSCTGYRSYPWTANHTGLPYLSDVFSSRDGEWVYMIGHNRGKCYQEYEKTDKFTMGPPIRFMCVFPNNEHVLSEYLFRPARPHTSSYVIRCRIPTQYQSWVDQPHDFTNLHIDLHAIDNYASPRLPLSAQNGKDNEVVRDFPSMEVSKTPKLTLPICHPLNQRWGKHQFNLTAHTRIKSVYGRDPRKFQQKSTASSPLASLIPWMKYHMDQGFDHFVIYDNDEEPNGIIEKMLQPYIERGLVSYKWWPMADCFSDYGGWKNMLIAISQMGATMSALNRYSDATKFFASMDVDEFFVVHENQTVWEYLQDLTQDNDTARTKLIRSKARTPPIDHNDVDGYAFKPTQMAPCNGTVVSKNQTTFEKWRCFSDKHQSEVKLIMKGGRMMNFMIHYPVLTTDRKFPTIHYLDDEKEGYLAHFRGSNKQVTVKGEEQWHESYSGLVQNGYTKRATFLDEFIAKHENDDDMYLWRDA